MKTVLYVHHVSGLGGASHSLLLLVKHIAAQGYRPVVAGQQVEEGVQAACRDLGITYYPLYLSSWAKSDLTWRDVLRIPNKLNTLRRLARICRKERVDLVHTNLSFCMDGALAAAATGRPHVFHVRDQIDTDFRQYFGGLRGAVRFMRRFGDRVIGVSSNAKRAFERFGAGDTVRVIPNAVEIPPEPAEFDAAEVRRAFGLPAEAFLIGQFGNIAPWKGQLDLVTALDRVVREHPQAHLVVVGSGSGSYPGEVRALVDVLGLGGHVTFIGHQDDIWPLMRAVDMVACPSLSEGFGRVVIEAMGVGKPVVGSTTGGIPDIIADGVNGLLVPPGAPERLALAISRLAGDADVRARLAEAGLRDATTLYLPETHAANVAKVYEELLGRR